MDYWLEEIEVMSVIVSEVNPYDDVFKSNWEVSERRIDTLRQRLEQATNGGPTHLVERHRTRNKLLVRERIERLIDPDSAFLELSPLAAYGLYDGGVHSAGIVTGIGLVQGQRIIIIANDATVKGGSFFHETVKKHCRAQEIAAENRLPCIYLVDCGGAYLPEQDRVFPDRDHFGNAFHRQCQMSASGLPQISIVFGGCTAGGAYIPALSDQVIMVDGNARIHLGGPSIVKVAINEDVDGETLGGAAMHANISGVCDYLATDEPSAIVKCRELVGVLHLQRSERRVDIKPLPPRYACKEIDGIVSADRRVPYKVEEIITRIVDDSRFSAFKPNWGASLVCGFASIHGFPVGIVGNNGALFSESALKGAHFIGLCVQRGIPLLFLHNISGFMVGTQAEQQGIAKHSAKMVYAMSTAIVPKLSIIIGGSYGAGNYGMCGRGFRPQFLFTWPSAELATMSADIATNVMLELRRKKHGAESASDEELASIERSVRQQYREQSDPYYATARLWDDGIIEPAQTRDVLGLCLDIVSTKGTEQHHAPVFRM